ncbi:MAG: hypothetical protein Q8R13_05335 [bacterium]|nr:hypothetical protein [bacterium]
MGRYQRLGMSLFAVLLIASAGCVAVQIGDKPPFPASTKVAETPAVPGVRPNVLFLNHSEGAWADVYVFQGRREVFGASGVLNLDLTLREHPIGFLQLGPSRVRYNLGPYRKQAYILPGHRYTFVYVLYREGPCRKALGVRHEHVFLDPERVRAVDVDDGPRRLRDRYHVLAVAHIHGGGQPLTLTQCFAPRVTVDLAGLAQTITETTVIFVGF